MRPSRAILGLLAMLLPALLLAAPAPASRLPASWQKGYTFTSWWHDQYAGAQAAGSFEQMRATGPDSVAFIATWYTDDLRDSTIAPRRRNAPTDASLRTIVRRAQCAGLRTFLRPLVDPYTGGWRGDYAPEDPAAWFRSYRRFIYHYAMLAPRLDVDLLSVGTELKSMTVPAHARTWRSIIAGVRARFPASSPTAGTTATRSTGGTPSTSRASTGTCRSPQPPPPATTRSRRASPAWGVDAIAARWSAFTDEYGMTQDYLAWLRGRYARWRKPILFTELGCPSKRESW